MITTAEFAAWLQEQGIENVAFVLDARGFAQTGTRPAVMITSYPGPGFRNERVTDVQAFQVRVRGPQQDKTSQAAMLAHLIDATIVRGRDRGPVTIGTSSVISMDRAGSGPAQYGPPDQGGMNVQMNCNYLIESDSGLG